MALVYSEMFLSLGAALRREHQLKLLNRIEKQALVAGTLHIPRPRGPKSEVRGSKFKVQSTKF